MYILVKVPSPEEPGASKLRIPGSCVNPDTGTARPNDVSQGSQRRQSVMRQTCAFCAQLCINYVALRAFVSFPPKTQVRLAQECGTEAAAYAIICHARGRGQAT